MTTVTKPILLDETGQDIVEKLGEIKTAIESGGTSGNAANKDLSNLSATGNAKFSKVSVADTGTATDTVNYITIDGVEKKIGGGSGSDGADKDLSNLTATGEAHFVKPTDIARREAVGLVKPDGTSIVVDSDGVMSTVVDPADKDLSNLTATGEAKFSKVSISATGTSTTEAKYITVEGTEYKLPEGGSTGDGADKDLSNLTATGEAHFVKPTDVATTSNLGLVKPDGTTVTITAEGVVSATFDGADKDLSNLSTTGEAKFVKPDAKATTSSLGLVKPDGTSILVSDEGVIAAPLQGADKDLSNLTTTGNAKFSKVSVASTGTATDVIKYITIDGTEKKLGGSEEDNLSITKNASDKIQAVGVISANDVTKAVKTWWGTEVSYAEIGTYYAYISGSSSDKYYVRKKTPTTADTVYTGIGVTSSLTITAVGTGTITLSDGDVYTYTESENLTDSTQYDEDTEYHITDDYIAPENYVVRLSTSAPSTTSIGKVGSFMLDITNVKLYICVAASLSSYTWKEVSLV